MGEPLRTIIVETAIILFAYAVVWFLISLLIRRNDFADVAWGLGYLVVCVYHGITYPIHPVVGVCYLLVFLWGARLSIFLFIRNSKKKEDFRYLQWRKEWGSTFYPRSFAQVYLLQASFLGVIISPVLFAASYSASELSILNYLGICIWSFGFYWQSVGDYQLRQFIKIRKSKEEVLKTGLWSYSRHPNYFGEVVMWWGIYVIVWPLEGSLYFILGPLTITLLIRYVSGVPMLERRYAGNKEYQNYKEEVPILIPKIFK